jgi:hypothetical protein
VTLDEAVLVAAAAVIGCYLRVRHLLHERHPVHQEQIARRWQIAVAFLGRAVGLFGTRLEQT